jgi:hypothetical protein
MRSNPLSRLASFLSWLTAPFASLFDTVDGRSGWDPDGLDSDGRSGWDPNG